MQHIQQIFLTAVALLLASLAGQAQNWDNIRSSGEYYYGVGVGATEAEASEAAMAELVSMIATHVSSEFVGIEDESNTNGKIDHKTRVLNCVRTYSQSTLTNVQKWVSGKAPNITVRRYMKRSELVRIYESRIAKAKDMVNIADINALIDMILNDTPETDKLQAADVNGDGEITIADVNMIIDLIVNSDV